MLCCLRHTYRALRRSELRYLTSPSRRRVNTFRVGDRVILKRDDQSSTSPILTKPLKHGGRVESHRGVFSHDDILGRSPRDVITSTAGRKTRLHHPTLAQHILFTPRLVTPIYPDVAERIVSLLDIHAGDERFGENGHSFEILEAGTGHGALTLHLAKAVHAFNVTHAPRASEMEVDNADTTKRSSSKSSSAVVHTLDISAAHSRRAQEVLIGFRRGLYVKDVQFHVGDIASFVEAQRANRGSSEAYLSAVVLDMPAAHTQMSKVADSIVVDGTLALFCPHITQVVEGVKLVQQHHLPLFLDEVVELNSLTTGGRQWDIRTTRARGSSREIVPQAGDESGSEGRESSDDPPSSSNESLNLAGDRSKAPEQSVEVICRPKYGEMITAGGFLALWKKLKI